MRQVEGGIAVNDLDSGGGELFPGILVLRFSAATRGVEHDAHFHAALVGGDDGLQQSGVGEDKHLDAQRFRGAVDGVEDRFGSIVR